MQGRMGIKKSSRRMPRGRGKLVMVMRFSAHLNAIYPWVVRLEEKSPKLPYWWHNHAMLLCSKCSKGGWLVEQRNHNFASRIFPLTRGHLEEQSQLLQIVVRPRRYSLPDGNEKDVKITSGYLPAPSAKCCCYSVSSLLKRHKANRGLPQ